MFSCFIIPVKNDASLVSVPITVFFSSCKFRKLLSAFLFVFVFLLHCLQSFLFLRSIKHYLLFLFVFVFLLKRYLLFLFVFVFPQSIISFLFRINCFQPQCLQFCQMLISLFSYNIFFGWVECLCSKIFINSKFILSAFKCIITLSYGFSIAALPFCSNKEVIQKSKSRNLFMILLRAFCPY